MISLLLPTRQRPEQLIRLYDSVMNTADRPMNVELVVYVDDDDDSYDSIDLKRYPQLRIIRGPRHHDGQVNLSIKWNECWKVARGEIYMHCGDDIVFRTRSWDSQVAEAINARPGKIALVWGNDWELGTSRGEFGTHCFIHKNWTDVVGRFLPPYFVSDYNDTWLNDVGEALKVRSPLDNMWIEHMHHTRGKAVMDQNTEERLKRHDMYHPDELYQEPKLVAERYQEIEKLREFINAQA